MTGKDCLRAAPLRRRYWGAAALPLYEGGCPRNSPGTHVYWREMNASLTPDPEALNTTHARLPWHSRRRPSTEGAEYYRRGKHLHPKSGVAFKALKQILRAQGVGCQCCRPQDRLTDRRDGDQRGEQSADQRPRNGPSRMSTTTGRDAAEAKHKRWRTGGATSTATSRDKDRGMYAVHGKSVITQGRAVY